MTGRLSGCCRVVNDPDLAEVLSTQWAHLSPDLTDHRNQLLRGLYQATEMIENGITVRWLVDPVFPLLLDQIEEQELIRELLANDATFEIRVTPYSVPPIVLIDKKSYFQFGTGQRFLERCMQFVNGPTPSFISNTLTETWDHSQDLRLYGRSVVPQTVRDVFDSSLPLNQDDHETVYKVAIVGGTAVGKTALIKSYLTSKPIQEQLSPTIGVDMSFSKGKETKFQIWDFSGERRYRSLFSNFLEGTNGLILAFDPTQHQTLDELADWLNNLENQNVSIPKILISTKDDLSTSSVINYEDIKRFSDTWGLNDYQFLRTSAVDRSNVNETFQLLSDEIVNFYNDHHYYPAAGLPNQSE